MQIKWGGGGGVYSYAIFHTFIRSRCSLQNHTRFQTTMVKIYILFSVQNGSKSILFGAAHTYIADIGESPQRKMCRSVVNFSMELNFFWGLGVDDCRITDF